MIVLIIIFATALCAMLYLHWIQTRSHMGKLLNKFPMDPYIPLIGHVANITATNAEILFKEARQIIDSKTETFACWCLNFGILNIVTADDAEIILSSLNHIKKSQVYRLLRPWLGTGLLTSSGPKWKHRRRILTPALHSNILRKFVDTFGQHAESLVRKIKEDEVNQSKTNVIPLITHTTFYTICETAMGTKLNNTDKEHSKYLAAVQNFGPSFVRRLFSPILYNDTIFRLSPPGKKHFSIVKTLHEFSKRIIKQREMDFKDSDVEGLDNCDEDGARRKQLALLDLLISAKKHRNEIDDKGIREEVDLFMFAGHDTTTMAICFALMVLSKHKNVQDKIISELEEIFGDDKRPASYEDLQNMKYLEMCIKESMRVYPSVPQISRLLTQDTQLTHHVAPAGTIIFIHIYNIHRDTKVFPDPEKFNPERFHPDNCKGRSPYAFIPFSAGPRNCIGQRFAMLEIKSILSSIFRNFTLESVDIEQEFRWAADMILRVNNPIHVKFKLRNN